LSVDPFTILTTSLVGLLLTMTIFLGPLVELYLDWSNDYLPNFTGETLSLPSHSQKGPHGVLQLRNLIVGPFAEEFVFRTVMIPILLKGGWNREWAVGISMMSFALCTLFEKFKREGGRKGKEGGEGRGEAEGKGHRSLGSLSPVCKYFQSFFFCSSSSLMFFSAYSPFVLEQANFSL
jgi:hypothetical protein